MTTFSWIALIVCVIFGGMLIVYAVLFRNPKWHSILISNRKVTKEDLDDPLLPLKAKRMTVVCITGAVFFFALAANLLATWLHAPEIATVCTYIVSISAIATLVLLLVNWIDLTRRRVKRGDDVKQK